MVGYNSSFTGQQIENKLTAVGIVPDGLVADNITTQHANVVAIQAAIDAAETAGGGIVFIPNGTYYYDRALLIKPNVIIQLEDNATTMILDQSEGDYGTGWNQWPMYSNFLFGTWGSGAIGRLTDHAIGNPVETEYTVTTTVAADAANYAAGDSVWIKSTVIFDIAPAEIPRIGQLNVVTAADAGTGVITLKYPNEFADTCVINNLTDTGANIHGGVTDLGIPLYMPTNAGVLGGTWENNITAAPLCNSWGIGSRVDIHQSTARNGVGYGNLFAYCDLRAEICNTHMSCAEFAMNAHGNNVHVGMSHTDGTATDVATGMIRMGEASRNNVVTVGTLNILDTCGGAVAINIAYNNTVTVNRVVSASNLTVAVVYILSSAFTGTRPDTKGNKVTIGYDNSTCAAAIRFDGDQVNNNTVCGFFDGTYTNSVHGALDSTADLNNMVVDSIINSGSVLTNATCRGLVIDNTYIAEGILHATDNAQTQRVQMINARSISTANMQAINSFLDNTAYSSVSDYTKTISIPALTFGSAMDRIDYEFYINVDGGAGTNTFNCTWDTTNTLFNFTDTGTDVVVIIKGKIFCNPAESNIYSYVEATVDGVLNTSTFLIDLGLSLDTTAYNLVFTFSADSATGTRIMRHGEVVYKTLGQR